MWTMMLASAPPQMTAAPPQMTAATMKPCWEQQPLQQEEPQQVRARAQAGCWQAVQAAQRQVWVGLQGVQQQRRWRRQRQGPSTPSGGPRLSFQGICGG